MIRSGFFLFLVSFCLLSCQNLKKPVLKKVANITINNLSLNTVVLSTEILYHNPNPVSGKMDSLRLDIYANDVYISNASQSLSTTIPSNGDFTVPVDISIPLSDIIKKESGILGGIINVLTMKKVKLKYEGVAKMNIAKVSFSVPFEYEEVVEVKL